MMSEPISEPTSEPTSEPLSKPSRPSALRPAVAVAVFCALLAVAGLGWTSASAQQAADAVLSDFQPTGDLALTIDGEAVPGAEIYQSNRARAFLVITSRLPGPAILNLRAGSLETVSLMSVARRDDGSVDVMAAAEVTPVGAFSVEGTRLAFTWDGKRAVLAPRESLTGPQTAQDLLDYSPSYGRRKAAYEPTANLVESLRGVDRPVEVRVFFNSKCGVCQQLVPRVMKLQEALDGSSVSFSYYGVPDTYDDPLQERLGVTGVPTAIVEVGGREVGRLSGGDLRVPEQGLVDLVSGS